MRAILKAVRIALNEDGRTNDISSLAIGMMYALGTLMSILDTDSNDNSDNDDDNQIFLLTRFLSTKGIPLVTLTRNLFLKMIKRTVGTFDSNYDSGPLLLSLWDLISPS